MALSQPRSPLDQIPNLEEVPPEKVRALEDRLAARLPKVRQQLLEQQEAANEMRHRLLS